jgi:hypothetical protein
MPFSTNRAKGQLKGTSAMRSVSCPPSPCSLLNDFHAGIVSSYVPGGRGGFQEAIVEGPMSSDEDH